MNRFLSYLALLLASSSLPAQVCNEECVLLSGNANLPLAQEVASSLHIPLGQATVKRFNDGEIQIQINTDVRNKNVFIIQPTCSSNTQSVNDSLMELFFLTRAVKRASAAYITAIIPYYGYARQDRKCTKNSPISAAEVALMLESSGINHIVSVDLHCGQIQGFFKETTFEDLHASSVFVPYFAQRGLHNVVIVSLDAGGVERTNFFLDQMSLAGIPAKMAMFSKHRAVPGVVESMKLIGEVAGSDVIIVDDMCDTGGTLIKAVELLKKNGAERIFAAITHPVFSGHALEKIGSSAIEEMVISDTIPLRKEAPYNIRCISIAPLIVDAISPHLQPCCLAG